jgi:hypothetical protein
MYRYSLEERVSIVKTYWITGSIKICQRRFVEQFGGRNPPSKRCIQLLVKNLIFSCCQLPFCEFPKHTTALHYRYHIQMYCSFVLFVNQHFPGIPASGTHCIFALAGRLKDFGISIERGALANGEAIRPMCGTQSAIFNRPNPHQAATASLKL